MQPLSSRRQSALHAGDARRRSGRGQCVLRTRRRSRHGLFSVRHRDRKPATKIRWPRATACSPASRRCCSSTRPRATCTASFWTMISSSVDFTMNGYTLHVSLDKIFGGQAESGFGLIMADGKDAFLGAGKGFRVTFTPRADNGPARGHRRGGRRHIRGRQVGRRPPPERRRKRPGRALALRSAPGADREGYAVSV